MPVMRDSSGVLCLGGVRLPGVIGPARAPPQSPATPAYVYDLDAMADEVRALRHGFDGAPHLVAYAMKANTAGAVVRTVVAEGCGADIVSGAELLVALRCGAVPDRIVYNGVAKTDDELDLAIASGPRGIGAIQIESVEEIARVEARALAAGRRARVGLRLNPSLDLDGATHAHIATGHDGAKFGVPRDDVPRAVAACEASSHLELVGMGAHVGSHFTSTGPYVDSAEVVFGIVSALRGAGRLRSLAFVNTGGGFGVDYAGADSGEARAPVPAPADFVRAACAAQRRARLDDLALYVEPGRCIVAAHGVLVARVIQVKVARAARWLMIDAGMNDLIRPALYQARHRVVPIEAPGEATTVPWRVVGPVCESSDDFGEHRLPSTPFEHVAILDAGAYGYTMASVYNGRQLPSEIFLAGGRVVARTERTSIEQWADERARAGSGA
jgi:diaminopimelate decarboxylase